jgi:MFS family permease
LPTGADARALMGSVLLCSIFTGLCGLAQNVWQLAVFRLLLGFGMGGEWASGAALVSETWPAEPAESAGFMQSSWAIGNGAALVTALVLPTWGWRAVFSSAFCRRSSRSGCGGTSKSRICGKSPDDRAVC